LTAHRVYGRVVKVGSYTPHRVTDDDRAAFAVGWSICVKAQCSGVDPTANSGSFFYLGIEVGNEKISPSKRYRVALKTNGRCGYCGVYLDHEICIDHVVPRSHGGTNSDNNLVAACRKCNSSKGIDTIEQFRMRIARKRYGIPVFTDAQSEWLLQHGVKCHMPPHVPFYFETIELTPFLEFGEFERAHS
jgi:hypothetical protein